MNRARIKQIFKIISVSTAVLLFLLLLSIYFLPTIISSHTVQARIQKTLSNSMKREVSCSNLVMSWSDGIKLSGLEIGNGAAPLLKTDIEQIIIIPSIEHSSEGRFQINLEIMVKNVHTELAPGSPKPPNPSPKKDPLTLIAETIQKIKGVDVALPVDLRLMLDVEGLQLNYKLPNRKSLSLQDFSFHFAMPSLSNKPFTTKLDGLVTVDGRKMGRVTLKAKVSDIVTKAQRVNLASAIFDVEAVAPGTNLNFYGGLNKLDGFTARCKLNLPPLFAIAEPFIPKNIPKMSGNIDIMLLAKADKNRDLQADLNINGTRLFASGGLMKKKKIDSLDLKLQQQIKTDQVKQLVDFSGGKFAISGIMDTAWSAFVNRPTFSDSSLDLTFGQMRINIESAHSILAPFLSSKLPFKNLKGEISLNSLNLKLKDSSKNGTLKLAGLGIKLPQLKIIEKKRELKLDGIEISLESLESELVNKLPTKVTANLLWSLNNAALSGSTVVSLKGGRGTIGLKVDDLDLKSKSPRKIAATATVTQISELDQATIGAELIIQKIKKRVQMLATATEKGDILASLPECTVTVDSIQVSKGGKHFKPVPVSAKFTATGITIPFDKRVKPFLNNGIVNISAGNFLKIYAKAALSESTPQNLISSGSVRLDLYRALLFASPFSPTGLKADGVATLNLNISAPLPTGGIKFDKQPLRSAKSGVSLCDSFELGLNLDNISLTVPSAKGAIKVAGLTSKPDLRAFSSKKGESILINGGLTLSSISGLPGAAKKLPPQLVSFLFNGELSSWRALHLHEELKVNPLAILQEAELNVDRIDSLLNEKEPFSKAILLKRLDGTIFATAETGFASELQLKQLVPGVSELTGNLNASARMDLSAGHELALQAAIKSRDFGFQLVNGTKVEGMRSDIILKRIYSLAAESQGEVWRPLSSDLVSPKTLSMNNQGATEIVDRINNDLRGDTNGFRSFYIRRLTTNTSKGVPLVLSALEGDLLFTEESTGLSFFQGDLLGGTLLARALFDLKPEIPLITAAGSFSNLDINLLLPKKSQKNQNAEVTGEIRLDAPLTAEQRELFEQLRLTVNIRKIGTDTVERALFSLDPYERNEKIVAQRKMLRHGNLKLLHATAVDGAFSLDGLAEVKGVAVDIPSVDRARISELPMRPELSKKRKTVEGLRRLLDLMRSDTVVIDPKGKIIFKRRGHEK